MANERVAAEEGVVEAGEVTSVVERIGVTDMNLHVNVRCMSQKSIINANTIMMTIDLRRTLSSSCREYIHLFAVF